MFGRVEDEWHVNDEILYTIGEHLAMLSEPRKRIALRIAAEFCNYPNVAVFIPQSDTHTTFD